MNVNFRVLFLQEISQKHGLKTDGGMSDSGLFFLFFVVGFFLFCVFFSEYILSLSIFLSTQSSGRGTAKKRLNSPYSDIRIDHNGRIDLLPPNF